MDRTKTIICICVLLLSGSVLAEQTEQFKKQLENYKAKYNFYAVKDSLYTIKSELELPQGFSYVDPKDSLSYSYWIANFPIWHQYKSVGNWKHRKQFNYDEVSRVIHLPWQGPVFKDVAIPVRLIGEFDFQFNNRFAFQIMPKAGELLTYKKWLQGKPVYNQRGEVLFKDAPLKDDTENEYYRFLLFCMQNVSFESITKICDTVSVDNIQAGDMFIAYDKTGKKGKLYIIFHLISNDSGDIMYLVANGCPEACDLYIPKINENRNNPWINIEQLRQLTEEYNNSNFYRFKTVINDNIE